MHTKKSHRFDTEFEAQTFADAYKVNGVLPVDTYVIGPFFMDEAVVFKGIPGAGTDTFWNVTVEIYK
jgi:hypothetical protein